MEMEAKRWDTESGKMLAHYRGGCTQPITTVAFSPSGKLLFTDGTEDPFIVWDVASGTRISDPASALKADWGPITGAAAPPEFVSVEKGALAIRSGQGLARVAVAQCYPFTIAETGLWLDIPAALHEATVYEPPRAGKSQFRNVVEVEVLEGGNMAVAAAWGTEPVDPASSINDPDLVTEQQLLQRGWKATGMITRTSPGGVPDKHRIFVREMKTGEKFRLATRNLTPPFVIIPDAKRAPVPAPAPTLSDKKAWSWSFNRLQEGRIPESSGAGFDAVLPKNAKLDLTLVSMIKGNTAEFRGGQTIEIDGVGDFGWKEPFSLAIWARATKNENNQGALIAKMNEGQTWRGYSLEFSNGVITMSLTSDFFAPGGPSMIEVRTEKSVKADAWHRVVMTYDGTAKSAGVRLYVDGQSEPLEVRSDRLTADIHSDPKLTIGARMNRQYFNGWLAEPRVYARALSPEEVTREFQKTPKHDNPGAKP